MKRKGTITKTGYLPDSPDRFNDYNIIPSNSITMKNVNFPIYGVDDTGHSKMMYPGNDYTFPGNNVVEIPVPKAQDGWSTPRPFSEPQNTMFTAVRRPTGFQPEFDINGNPVNNGAIPTNPDASTTYLNDPMQGPLPAQPPKPKVPAGMSKFLNDYGADVVDMGLGFLNNALYKNPEDPNLQTKLGGSDNRYAVSSGSRGDYDVNSGIFQPDRKVPVQFGEGGMIPKASLGLSFGDNSETSSLLTPTVPLLGATNKFIPDNNSEEIDFSKMNTTNATNKIPSDIKKDTIIYLGHQQGVGGINAILRDASGGKPVSDEIASNMKNNVGDDFYKKYNKVNAQNFLDYWSTRFMNNYKKAIKTPTPWDKDFDKAGANYGLNPMFLKTVASIESDFVPNANINKKTQYKGLFQIGTNEQKDLGITNPYDPIQSINGGAKLIAQRKPNIKFQEGGEYELDDRSIAELKNQGYNIEYI